MFTQKAVWQLGKVVLDFANLRREDITSAATVEQHFPPSLRYRLLDPDEIAAKTYRDEHKLLCRMLDQLLLSTDSDRAKVAAFVSNELKRDPHLVVGHLQPGLQLGLSERSTLGLRTTWLIFICELAANEKQRQYFGRCLLPECKKYFLHKYGGKPGGFCCDKHGRKGNKRGITVRDSR